MSVKYKIENAKLNKKLVGDTVTVSKVKKTHGDGFKGGKNRKTTRDLLVEFINRQDKFNQNMVNRFDKLENRIDNIVTANNLKE